MKWKLPRKIADRLRRQPTAVKVVLVGGAATFAATLATWVGLLAEPERQLTDKLVKYCQIGRPPPTRELIHLDIDDTALQVIGKWPWSRTTLSQVLSVVNDGKPKAVALDIIFPDAETGTSGDAMLARTLAAGNYVLAYSLQDTEQSDGIAGPNDHAKALRQRVLGSLAADPLAGATKVALQTGSSALEVQALIPELRQVVVRQKVVELLETIEADAPPATPITAPATAPATRTAIAIETDPHDTPLAATLRSRLFGPDSTAGSVGGELVREAIDRAMSQRAIGRFAALPPTSDGPWLTRLYSAAPKDVPRPEFAAAAKSAGFVTYFTTGRGVVRAVPIVCRLASDGAAGAGPATAQAGKDASQRVVPSLGLALLCAAEGIPLEKMAVSGTDLILPLAGSNGGVTRVPLRMVEFDTVGRGISGVMDLVWPSSNKWETLYDPTGKTSAQHMSLAVIGDILECRRRIAISELLLAELIQAHPGPTDPPGAIERLAESHLSENQSFIDGMREMVKSLPASQWTDEHREAKRQVDEHDNVAKQLNRLQALRQATAAKVAEVRRALAGKPAIMGFTATSSLDRVATSIHSSCPGVMVHGAVFNSILTGNTVRLAPMWATLLAVVLMGALTTIAASGFSPWAGLVRIAVLTTAYSALNGFVLFGPMRTVLGMAGPLAVVPLVWGGCTVMRFVFERADRRRITERFSTRVDPQLVQYVLENPERVRFDGEERVMTVVFTDLAGFTTISEKLGRATVPLLNEYFQLMVPIIRAHNGYVNKFLGDGMMFFFNGVYPNDNHARDAVAAILKMQAALVTFNESLTERGLPNVLMRVGMTTGPMVVGDAGSDGASDYTVLGDNVNLAARLESANKATGTLVMVNDTAADALRSDYLLRPIGSLQVVGKSQGVMTYEVISPLASATEAQRELVRLSGELVEAYRRADWPACDGAMESLEQAAGPTKFTRLYHKAVERERAHAATPDNPFTGTIELTEK